MIGSILVVEDCASLRAALMDAVRGRASDVRGAGSVEEALAVLASFAPDVVILDVVLPDGTAVDVVDRARAQSPTPRVLAVSGCAGPETTFRLGEMGVRAFLSKPVREDALHAALDTVTSTPPDLTLHLRGSVGLRPIFAVEEEVRRTMVDEALARAEGSKRRAAGILSVSRQLMQHILRRHVA